MHVHHTRAMRTVTGWMRLPAAAVTAAALLAGCGGGSQRADTPLIVFARAPATNVFSDLYILQTDGSLRRLTHGAIDSAPSWSPDGQRIVFLRTHADGR